MNRTRTFQSLVCICLLFIISLSTNGCSNSISPTSGNNTNNNGGAETGNLTGIVSLSDSLGNDLDSFAGITITIEGTAFSTVTNQTGVWRIDGVPQGTYVVRASMQGYGFVRVFNVLVPGPGLQYLPNLGLCSPTNFPIFLDHLNASAGALNTVVTIPTAINHQGIIGYYLSTDSLFTIGNARDYELDEGYEVSANKPDQVLQNVLTSAMLHSYGFPSGTKIYMAYFSLALVNAADGRGSNYVDPSTGHIMYTSLGSLSNVISAIVP